MRPLELKIVQFTPSRCGRWQKSHPSPAFRSPPPWLSRPMPSPLPSDTKSSYEYNIDNEKLPPQYSHSEAGQPPCPEGHCGKPATGWVANLRRNCNLQDFFSEFFGTFIMVLFGDGVVAQVVLSKGTKGDYQSISWGWGIAVMLGVFVARKSGGHLNPAVTLANCVYRKCPWYKFPIYTLAQVLGAMMGAMVVYANYVSALDLLEGDRGLRTADIFSVTSSAGVFSTYPAPFLSTYGQFFSEFLSSTIMMFCVFSLVDAGLGIMMPLFLLFLTFGIGASFGWETGYAMNLARDFGPRLFCYFVGYGDAVFTAGNSYFWIPMVAPFCGTLFGGLIYNVFFYNENHTPTSRPWICLPDRSD